MTLKDILTNSASLIKEAGKRIGSAILDANIKNVINAGLFVGSACVAIYYTVKRHFNKKKINKGKQAESFVEETIDLNYSDSRELDRLDKAMSKVKKQMMKGSKAASKKNRTTYAEFERKVKDAAKRHRDADASKYPFSDIILKEEIFKDRYAESRRNTRRVPENQELVYAWQNF